MKTGRAPSATIQSATATRICTHVRALLFTVPRASLRAMLICFYNGIPPSRPLLSLGSARGCGPLISLSGLCHTVTEGSEVSNPLILIFTRRGLFMRGLLYRRSVFQVLLLVFTPGVSEAVAGLMH